MTTAVYPGTFDPIHNGHFDIVRRAVNIFDELIVAVYDRPLKSLLFDTSERLALLEHGCEQADAVAQLIRHNPSLSEYACLADLAGHPRVSTARRS